MAFDTALAANDFDPRFGISDGIHFNGFVFNNPAYIRPNEGKSGRAFSNEIFAGKRINVSRYSGEIKMQFKLSDNWGSAYDNAYTTIGSYQNSPDLTKGLYLEMYRHHASEKYHIRYITVDMSLGDSEQCVANELYVP